jgi:hypothetical protein
MIMSSPAALLLVWDPPTNREGALTVRRSLDTQKGRAYIVPQGLSQQSRSPQEMAQLPLDAQTDRTTNATAIPPRHLSGMPTWPSQSQTTS